MMGRYCPLNSPALVLGNDNTIWLGASNGSCGTIVDVVLVMLLHQFHNLSLTIG
jgi:hypothetical protein